MKKQNTNLVLAAIAAFTISSCATIRSLDCPTVIKVIQASPKTNPYNEALYQVTIQYKDGSTKTFIEGNDYSVGDYYCK